MFLVVIISSDRGSGAIVSYFIENSRKNFAADIILTMHYYVSSKLCPLRSLLLAVLFKRLVNLNRLWLTSPCMESLYVPAASDREVVAQQYKTQHLLQLRRTKYRTMQTKNTDMLDYQAMWKYFVLARNLAIANKLRVSCAHRVTTVNFQQWWRVSGRHV